MIIKEVVQVGNPLLRGKSKSVKDVKSKEAKRVIKNLVDSMRYHGLVGMAASQIGEKVRIFVTEPKRTEIRKDLKDVDELKIYINPKITWKSKKEVVMYEGCGSVAYAELFGPVKRPEKIEIEAFDEKGKKFKIKTGGFLARVIQHEYDHLDGIEFTEKITDMRKIMSEGEFRKKMR